MSLGGVNQLWTGMQTHRLWPERLQQNFLYQLTMMSSGAVLIGQLAAAVPSSKWDRTNRITARQNWLWIIKTIKKLNQAMEGERQPEGRGEKERKRERERERESERVRERDGGTVTKIKKFEGREAWCKPPGGASNFCVSLIWAKRSFNCVPPRGKAQITPDFWNDSLIEFGQGKRGGWVEKEGGGSRGKGAEMRFSLLFSMNHYSLWKIFLNKYQPTKMKKCGWGSCFVITSGAV